MIKAQDVKKLREMTGAGMVECKKALEESSGDFDGAIKNLRKRGSKIADKKIGRGTSEGYIGSYIHSNGKIGVLIEVNCETDFVARGEEFRNLVHDIAMHIAASDPKYVSFKDISSETIKEKKEEFMDATKNEKKPKEIIEKIIEGKLKKHFDDVCLLTQPFVKDLEKTIEGLITEKIAKFGENVQVKRFVKFEIE
jgi:elongation factor Ts